jgi:hypothetical protein
MEYESFSEATGGRARSFCGLSAGETAGPGLSGQCGGGKTPPEISRLKDQPRSLGAEEKLSYPGLHCDPSSMPYSICSNLMIS